MFCDKCGTQFTPGALFCNSCGKSLGSAPSTVNVPGTASAAAPLSDTRVQRHVQLLATLWLVNGILRFAQVGWVLIAGQMLPLVMNWGMGGRYGNWPFNFLPLGLYSIGVMLAVFGAVHLLLAWGLFQREPWARTLGVVLGFLALLRPPFGTALGIYTLWVLLPRQSGQEYERLSRATAV